MLCSWIANFKSSRRILFLVLLQFLSLSSWAVSVDSLYQAKVPVVSQSNEDRQKAFQDGITQVFIKVSGDPRIVENNPAIAAMVAQAQKYAEEYNYALNAPENKDFPYVMSLSFDPDVVNKLLQTAGATVWDIDRPLVLAWIVIDDKTEGDILDSSAGIPQTLLESIADARGLPILFPVMDMADLNLVSTKDVINKNLPLLLQASQRYGANGVLIGHIKSGPTGLTSEWLFAADKEKSHWVINGTDLTDIFSHLVNNTADFFAKQYITKVNSVVAIHINVHVKDLIQTNDLVALMKYLQHLGFVTDVQLTSIKDNTMTLDVTLRGSKKTFIDAVKYKNLILLPDPNPTPSETDVMYQWKNK